MSIDFREFVEKRADEPLKERLIAFYRDGSPGAVGLVRHLLTDPIAHSLLDPERATALWGWLDSPDPTLSDMALPALYDFAACAASNLGYARVSPALLLRAMVGLPQGDDGLRAVQEQLAMAGVVGLQASPGTAPPDPTYQPLGFGTLLNAKAAQWESPPLVGRDDILEEILAILTGDLNPLLVGEPGVGKSAMAEGLAWHLTRQTGLIPPELQRLQVVDISVPDLLSGTSLRGELEERLKAFVSHLGATPDLVVFIDEIHALLAGQSEHGQAVVNTLKPALARKGVRVIGATTEKEYHRYFRDQALDERFRRVDLPEPKPDEAEKMLRGRSDALIPRAARARGVLPGDGTLRAAVRLTVAHLPDERLPRKAVKLVQEAGARKALALARGRDVSPVVTPSDIASTLAKRLNIPAELLLGGPTARLVRLQNELCCVFGQPSAARSVVDGLCAALAGAAPPGRPLGVFLFHGPPGVGKTSISRAVARALTGGESALVELPMADFHAEGARHRLMGPPPGYRDSGETWTLFSAVRTRPASVVVFDRVDRLHPEVGGTVAQVLRGRALDGLGRPTDFSKCVFILNAGPALSAALDERGTEPSLLGVALTPEVASLVRRIVPFAPLERAALRAVVLAAIDSLPTPMDEVAEVVTGLRDSKIIDAMTDDALELGGNGYAVEAVVDQVVGEALRDRFAQVLDIKLDSDPSN